MQIMFLLCLLTCFALNNFNVQAKVVDSFNNCKQFFYQGKEPQGMDQNARKICQKLKYDSVLYATLYSTAEKIPLYSAYKFNPECKATTTHTEKQNSWHIEPQLISTAEPDHMMLEGDDKLKDRKDEIKKTQALSSDYDQTGYDRGHLYPNSFQCGDDRKVTFTLTNAAPMDACFNRVQWKAWEGYLQSFLKDNLKIDSDSHSDSGSDDDNKKVSVYIVTGTVPGPDKIPQSGNRDLRRVTVPSLIWTAVCYEHKEHDKSFSFGYIGVNQPEFNIKLKSVSEMNKQLSKSLNAAVKIFHDDCFSNNPASEKAKNQFLKQIKLPQYQRLKMSKSDQNTFLAVEDLISSDSKDPTIVDLTAKFNYGSSSSHLTSNEKLKRGLEKSCVVTTAKKRRTSDKQKREVSEGSESIECQLVPEKSVDGKTSADGSPCSHFVNNGYQCTCSTQDGKTKLCCSTPCLYQDQLKGYRCYSGKTQIQCSPQYSLITAKGNRCRDDHPCATYGKDYYWCFIDSKSWEYCSPPLWGSRAKDGKYCRSNYACAKYDKNNTWCYTDDKNWNSCCTSDDYFSAVNYKTCKPDHPCGYHGKNYLWCNTINGSWDYCCKEFKK